jgi:hypothetical protein
VALDGRQLDRHGLGARRQAGGHGHALILAVLFTSTAAAMALPAVVASADDGPLVRPDSKLVSAGDS